jgi:hypothetical protein
MREFVFTIEYKSDIDAVADVFIEYPSALSKSIACSINNSAMWRLDRITGPEAAIDRLDHLLLDTERCNECPNRPACQSHREYERLARDATSCTIYTYRSGIERCRTLPTLAREHLGDGLLYETQRRENEYEWRILMRNDANVGRLYDAMQAELPDGLCVNLSHLTEPTHWTDEAITAAKLPYEQRESLELAVEHGYYQTPRETSLSDLADTVEIPQSTLQYRLQRAESWLASKFVTECL